MPIEVLDALDARTRLLGIQKGTTIATALLELLDRDDDELVKRVDRTQQRYDTARRLARRGRRVSVAEPG